MYCGVFDALRSNSAWLASNRQEMKNIFNQSFAKLLTEETVEQEIRRRIEHDEENADRVQRVKDEIFV